MFFGSGRVAFVKACNVMKEIGENGEDGVDGVKEEIVRYAVLYASRMWRDPGNTADVGKRRYRSLLACGIKDASI